MQKLYVDMDGTIVDFISQINKYGFWRSDKPNKVDWKKVILKGPQFWNEMTWISGAEAAFKELQAMAAKGMFELFILSSIDFEEGREGKKLWIQSHTNFPLENVIFCLEPEYKAHWANEHSWLIDDRQKSLAPFAEAGGNTIEFTGDWSKTLNSLLDLVQETV